MLKQPKLELDATDEALLDGAFGAAAAHAMKLLKHYGEVVGADRFIPISSAHIDGCLYHGASSIDFARRFVDMGGRVRVPTTLNVAAVDALHPGWNRGPADLLAAQNQLTSLYKQMGCVPTLTCAPYQRKMRPALGQHIAWAESNAIVFANSVLGARTDRYGDFTDLCAALTGRVPLAGLHRDENRIANLIVDVVEHSAADLPRDLYFAAVGYNLGRVAAGYIPALVGLPRDATEDELKALGAASASSGPTALFHAVGITPEAPTLESALGGRAVRERISISKQDLHDAIDALCQLQPGEPVAAMCVGTPHFSRAEFAQLAALVAGRRAASGVEAYASTSREIAAETTNSSDYESLHAFGVKIVVDTCTYVAPVVRNDHGVIVTNSAKFAHYGPGNLKRRVGLMTLERCVRSAELGVLT